MSIPILTELNEPPIPGKFYMVPCVHYKRYSFAAESARVWVPAVGEAHNDSEYLGVEGNHYHFDLRFINKKLRRHLFSFYEGSDAKNVQLHMGELMSTEGIVGKPELKRLKCVREQPVFLDAGSKGQPLKRFVVMEKAFAKARVKCNRCPHRGFDLSTVPAINGVKVCPMHGLGWDAKTGRQHVRFDLPPVPTETLTP